MSDPDPSPPAAEPTARPVDRLLAAAKAALVQMSGSNAHRASCRFVYLRASGHVFDNDESRCCTCALWQTREALRMAIAEAETDGD